MRERRIPQEEEKALNEDILINLYEIEQNIAIQAKKAGEEHRVRMDCLAFRNKRTIEQAVNEMHDQMRLLRAKIENVLNDDRRRTEQIAEKVAERIAERNRQVAEAALSKVEKAHDRHRQWVKGQFGKVAREMAEKPVGEQTQLKEKAN